jgi:hypothetical protein
MGILLDFGLAAPRAVLIGNCIVVVSFLIIGQSQLIYCIDPIKSSKEVENS